MDCGAAAPHEAARDIAGATCRYVGEFGSTLMTLTSLLPPFATQSLLLTASKKAKFGAEPTVTSVAIFVAVSITETEFPVVFTENTREPVVFTARKLGPPPTVIVAGAPVARSAFVPVSITLTVLSPLLATNKRLPSGVPTKPTGLRPTVISDITAGGF